MNSRPLITVCIPAYNRAHLLSPLLESIFNQDYGDFNILICEDKSPERIHIESIVKVFSLKYPDRIQYHENKKNLGYDANIRELVRLATGEYCVFMGNDDLMCPGALHAISNIINRELQCGVIVRSYATFDKDPSTYNQVYRYYPDEVIFPAGATAIIAGYRRSVVIPGMVIHRDSANELATGRYDGTLLYQLYLVGMILAKRSAVFTPQIIALRRDGTPPDFGNSESEKGKFTPQNQTPNSSLHFMSGMLKIAFDLDLNTGFNVFRAIRSDVGNYSYPILSIQASKPRLTFLRYSIGLARLGLWRYPLFYIYFILLLFLGAPRVDCLIGIIKSRLGYTPMIGARMRLK